MKTTLIISSKVVSNNKFYSGMHWVVRKKLADAWHEEIFYECKRQKIPKFSFVHITIKSISKRVLDADNICAKLCIDGLVLAEIIKDDSPEYVKSVTLVSEKGKEEQTIIIIQEAKVGEIKK